MIILLTGPPGCGKTTAVVATIQLLPREDVRGFVTEEVRNPATRERTGFSVRNLDGRRAVIARAIPGGEARVGRYAVFPDEFERAGLPVFPAPPGTITVLDEIGKMECHSERFVREVESLIASEAVILATIPERAGGFPGSLRERLAAHLLRVTPENRRWIPEMLAKKLSDAAARQRQGQQAGEASR